ncbi:MAG TPA: septal ring lytic transglycosylase RlpA family protein [Pseudolabrys sp.]|nr:septal ring lytic transglycosylase RlpA family protein [Pseudolabrys sp.]
MFPPASSFQHKRKSNSLPIRRGGTLTKFALAIALLCGMVWDNIEYSYAAINAGRQNLGIEPAPLPLAPTALPSDKVRPAPAVDVGFQPGAANCPLIDGVDLALLELPVHVGESLPPAIARQTGHDMLNPVGIVLAAGSNGMEWVSYARQKMTPKFAIAYQSVRKLVTMMDLTRIQNGAARARATTTIVGIASTYNPYRDGKQEGGTETASGELYDPDAWTAAIQIGLRNYFGGIRYGRLYQPAYALVESGDKQVIVKVNDVGHLRPGRVLDLNERTMRYFDPFLTRGLLADTRITLLPGEDWTPGPIGSANLISFAAAEWRAAPAQPGSILPAAIETESPGLRVRFPSSIKENDRAEAKPSVGG